MKLEVAALKISDHVTEDRIRVPLEALTKEGTLHELVTLLAKGAAGSESILASVLEREQRMTTGIGRGVAIPHAKSDLVADLEIACGIPAQPIDYGSIDRSPVRVLFLIVSSPAHAEMHLHALGSIAQMLAEDSVRDDIFAAHSAAEFLSLLKAHESDGE